MMKSDKTSFVKNKTIPGARLHQHQHYDILNSLKDVIGEL